MRMKNLRFLTPTLTFILATALPAWAEIPAQLVQAQQAYLAGQPRVAIEILEPLTQDGSQVLDEASQGMALNMLGTSYRDLERYDKARRYYQASIHILKQLPDQRREYASALDNLGGVEELSGHLEASKAARTHAKDIYQELGYHCGQAIALSNLTNIALKQHDLKTARRQMQEAFREIELSPSMDVDNLATIYTVKGALARSEGDLPGAIEADQKAIELWTHTHGAMYKLGVAYALRAEAYALSGNNQLAVADFKKALELLDVGKGKSSQAYLRAELVYARVLRTMGSAAEASRIEQDAQAISSNLSLRTCGGCTISAESFR